MNSTRLCYCWLFTEEMQTFYKNPLILYFHRHQVHIFKWNTVIQTTLDIVFHDHSCLMDILFPFIIARHNIHYHTVFIIFVTGNPQTPTLVFAILNVCSCVCRNHVLQITSGLEEMGNVRLELLLCLFIFWVVIFICLCKGIKVSGKVHYNYNYNQ